MSRLSLWHLKIASQSELILKIANRNRVSSIIDDVEYKLADKHCLDNLNIDHPCTIGIEKNRLDHNKEQSFDSDWPFDLDWPFDSD